MKKLLFLATAAAMVFSSCSKDATEVAPAPVNGKVVMTASMGIGEATRTFLNENGKYEWSHGDMAGVISVGVSKPVMLHTPNGGVEAEFIDPANQIDYVGTNDLLFFYPYTAEVNFAPDQNNKKVAAIEMSIPQVQIYRPGSFSTMIAPAIAPVEKYDVNAANDITFKPVASYVKVPIRGIGAVKSLTMRILDSNGMPVYLAGTGMVDVTDCALELTNTLSDFVTIDFGKGKGALSLYEGQDPVNVMFVVPAHLDVMDAQFHFDAIMEDESDSHAMFYGPSSETASPAIKAAYSNVAPNAIISGKEINLGTDNYYVIDSCRDFVTWAHQQYLGRNPNTAYIVRDLDFAAYAAGGADAEKVTSCTAEEWNAIQWYRSNDYAIYSENVYGDEYKILGNVDGKNGAPTISDLEVIGTSVFGKMGTVENLIIKNIKLNATDNSVASFVGDIAMSVDVDHVVAKNVTVDGGSIVGSSLDEANVVDYLLASLLNEDEGAYVPAIANNNYPTLANNEINYAPTFDADEDANITRFVDTNVIKFGEILSSTGKTIVSVDNETVSNVGVIFDKCDYDTHDKPFSVVIGETSYWNGLTYESNDDTNFTAEELAYAVANRLNVELRGLDIDLMGTSDYANGKYAQNWEAVCNFNNTYIANIKVDGFYKEGQKDLLDNTIPKAAADSRARVISNINIETELNVDGDAVEHASNNNYSLFGQDADLNEVTVKGLSISLTENINTTNVAGLAYTGSATDVEVDGLEIRTEIENITSAAIGAVISRLPNGNIVAKNCVVKNANILLLKADGTANKNLARGLFGYMKTKQSDVKTFDNCSIAVNSPAKYLIGKALVEVPITTSSQDNPIFNFTKCSANYLVKTLAWSQDKGNYPVKVVKDGVISYVNITTDSNIK